VRTQVTRDVPRLFGEEIKQRPKFRGELDGESPVLVTVKAPGRVEGGETVELPKTLKLDLGGGQELEMVRIGPGEFLMGAPDGEKAAKDDEKPRHRVQITRAYFLGKYKLTRGQYRTFVKDQGHQTEAEKGNGAWGWNAQMGKWTRNRNYNWMNVGFQQTDEHPVVCVSWNDAQAFCAWLEKRSRQQMGVRLGPGSWRVKLPTEAQWECACRAGTTTPFHCGQQLNGEEANCNGHFPYGTEEKGPYQKGTTPVGKYAANRWGLYDMHGNAWEWCEDYYDKDFYAHSPLKDPINTRKGSEEHRLLRGGSWDHGAELCRAACRGRNCASYCSGGCGFRVALRLD
jgi:formylglycine-generating enzyme required for sulfatase activity